MKNLQGDLAQYPLVLVALLSACASPSSARHLPRQQPLEYLQPEGSACFKRVGECPNWDEALAIARKRACCGMAEPQRPNRGPRDCNPCQQNAPCDICLFLNSDRPPNVVITAGLPEYAKTRPTTLPGVPGSMSKWSTQEVTLQRELCYDKGKIDLLATTMIHESHHLCVSINYEQAKDALNKPTPKAEECQAYNLEKHCGFNTEPPEGSQCVPIK